MPIPFYRYLIVGCCSLTTPGQRLGIIKEGAIVEMEIYPAFCLGFLRRSVCNRLASIPFRLRRCRIRRSEPLLLRCQQLYRVPIMVCSVENTSGSCDCEVPTGNEPKEITPTLLAHTLSCRMLLTREQQICGDICSDLGSKYFGTQYGREVRSSTLLHGWFCLPFSIAIFVRHSSTSMISSPPFRRATTEVQQKTDPCSSWQESSLEAMGTIGFFFCRFGQTTEGVPV